MAAEEIRAELQRHLHHLSVIIGERSIYRLANLQSAEDYVFRQFEATGYQPRRQHLICMREQVANVIAGDPNPRGYYILGAHFDTVPAAPALTTTTSGVAVLLTAARLAKSFNSPRPWTFIGFTTEEPPVLGFFILVHHAGIRQGAGFFSPAAAGMMQIMAGIEGTFYSRS